MNRALSGLAVAVLLTAACGNDGASKSSVSADVGGGDASQTTSTTSTSQQDYPSFIAQRWCDVQAECGCSDAADCATTFRERLERSANQLASSGLSYDPTCPAQLAEWVETRGCNGYAPRAQIFPPCSVFHGDVARGEACTWISSTASDCQQGLRCEQDPGATSRSCMEISDFAPLILTPGASCKADEPGTCDPLDAFCNPESRCQSYPAAGEPCDRGRCAIDAYCDATTETCLPAISRGEACEDGVQCGTRFCDEGTCVSFCYSDF